MSKKRIWFRTRRNGVRWTGLITGSAVLLTIGCEERERLTFATPSDGIGPVTTITQPQSTDTSVVAGPAVFVNGRTVDPDGVDTVYFLVTGGNHNFQPFTPNPATDTLTFGVPIITAGQSGATYTIHVYGVDALGTPGDTSTRVIHIQ